MIKHITLGTKEVFFYNYNGEQLPLRPISSFELDDCFFKSLYFADKEIADLVVKIKLSLVSIKDNWEYDNKRLAELKKYFDDLDYWIVYHAMKDFQDIDFQKPEDGFPKGIKLVRQMQHIHEIATEVLTYSYQPKEIIQEIIKTDDGETVATILFTLNIPLADFGNLTQLQKDFLILSKIEKTKPKRRKISKTGDKMDIRELLKGMI